jgi:hypothetical protein
MKNTLLVSLLLTIFAQFAFAQKAIERKIIIEHAQFYYCTVNNDLQLAELHNGNVQQNINNVSAYNILPVGREISDPFVPLCFDINKGEMLAINWILNSNNSRNDALKKINLAEAIKSQNLNPAQVLEQSFLIPPIAAYEPWQFMLRRNNTLSNNFFDIAWGKDNTVLLALCNQNELFIWMYNGSEWKHSDAIPVNFHQYFSLIAVGTKIGILSSEGVLNTYSVTGNQWKLQKQIKYPMNLQTSTLVIDKDNQKVLYLNNNDVEQSKLSLTQLMKSKAKKIIL